MIIATTLVALGVTAENLTLAERDGYRFLNFRDARLLMIPLLAFLIEGQALVWGERLGGWIESGLGGRLSCLSIALLGAVGIMMTAWSRPDGSGDGASSRSENITALVLATSAHMLFLGLALEWQGVDVRETKFILFPFIAFFLVAGFLLGLGRRRRACAILVSAAPWLVCVGTALLLAEKVSATWGLRHGFG